MVDQVGEVDGTAQAEQPLKGGAKTRIVEEWSDVSINSPITSRRPSFPEVQQSETEANDTADNDSDTAHSKVTKEGEMIEHGDQSGSDEDNDKEAAVEQGGEANGDENTPVETGSQDGSEETAAQTIEDRRERDLPPLPAPSPTAPTHNTIPLPLHANDTTYASRDAPTISETSPTDEQAGRSRTFSVASSRAPGRKIVAAALQVGTTTGDKSSGQATISSMVFVVQALEEIAASRDARRRKPLADATQKALTAIKESAPDPPSEPTVIFEPLHLACETGNVNLTIRALDCIGKLISYSYFSQPEDDARTPTATDAPHPDAIPALPPTERAGPPLIERAIDTICDCFQGETTHDKIQLQIIQALLSAVLDDKLIVHGAGLLKAVRTTYNIFLLSRATDKQMIAQGALTQMVDTVFERVKTRNAVKEARAARTSEGHGTPTSVSVTHIAHEEVVGESESTSEDADVTVPSNSGNKVPHEKITLQSFENRKSFDDERIDGTLTVLTRADAPTVEEDGEAPHVVSEEDEIFIKDAFLVFRAMCKLSIKNLPVDQITDLRSHGMRSKLLSLLQIRNILKSHMSVFTSPFSQLKSSATADPASFVDAIKQYLCLCLSRNAASAVSYVFEICCEIFWLMISNLRFVLTKEIEVFLKEIYLAILDNRNSSAPQKQYLLSIMERLCSDPQIIVEIYLNYDCESSASNIFEPIIEHLSRLTSTPVHVTDIQQQAYKEHSRHLGAPNMTSFPPSLTTANISAPVPPTEPAFPLEYANKQHSLLILVEVLRSLVSWAQKGMSDINRSEDASWRDPSMSRESVETPMDRLSTANQSLTPNTPVGEYDRSLTPDTFSDLVDNPEELERAKLRKTRLIDGISKFNFKPKRGIKYLLEHGFIKDAEPKTIAEFLYTTEQLNKAAVGEYLGEGDAENIAIMHAFVDNMDFTRMRFVDALRRFLQSFRLPGEAQKIDRLMLKFAERYISGNPNAFANADTAYVLAYSVIMLNTDAHSDKLKGKPRMTREEFIRNNRGINDNKDLPEEYLNGIYEEIQNNEIVLDSERNALAISGMAPTAPVGIAAGIGQTLATIGRDLQKEKYMQASEVMANKTEQTFRTLLRHEKKSSSTPRVPYIFGKAARHAGPMFSVTWMSFYAALSDALQASSPNDTETVQLCMEGFKLATRISCLFELETPKEAFVSALAKFTHLNNLSEMQAKHVEALKVLLDVAQTEGNLLKGSWKDVLTCISQLERFQLISSGVDEGAVPDVSKARFLQPDGRRTSMQSVRSSRTGRSRASTHYLADVAEESRSREVVIAVDRIFANTAKLNGDAIVHFVRALSEVSWQEIQSSGQSDNPRMFGLQKLVEISYYNMNRIRVEWSALWAILGEHFNQVGCHSNTSIVFFALDSLRQLSMRFLEKDELAHFKFQKDFLRPFEYIIANNNVVPVKDHVLRCLHNMVQARGENIKSGWQTMFCVFRQAAKENYDQLVSFAFENTRNIYRTRFSVVVQQGSFADMIICLTQFAKNQKFQKVSLQAIETLKTLAPTMLACPECPLYQGDAHGTLASPIARNSKEDPMMKYWFPVLFSFHDILMTGEDLEVRTRALNCLFDTLTKYGGDFPTEFWDTICQELLFPTFTVLKSKSEMQQFSSQEAIGMWLSTTMIQALRELVALFTHYFDILEHMLNGFLELLITCICQENDTIALIGSSCLQQLILQSVTKLRNDHWEKIVNAFVQLFEITSADQLFSAVGRTPADAPPPAPSSSGRNLTAGTQEPAENDDSLRISGLTSPTFPPNDLTGPTEKAIQDSVEGPTKELEDYKPAGQQTVVSVARRRFFNRIITQCVLHVVIIRTVAELFSNDAVYNEIPSHELLRLMALVKKSFMFARKFNADRELRTRLWREGYMKQPPNLLKQETMSASTYISILFRMYHDEKPERRDNRPLTEAALIPLCVDILHGFVNLDPDTQNRNIQEWAPVVVDVLEGYTHFPEEDFDRHVTTFYPLAIDVLSRGMSQEVQASLKGLLRRVGEVKKLGIVKG